MQVLKQLFQIFIRKLEPSDLSYNVNAAIALTLVTLHFRYLSFSFAGAHAAISYSILYCATQIGFIYLMLRLSNKSPRFVQTLTGLLGIALVFVIALTVMVATIILAVLVPFLAIWYLYLYYLIIKSAFECTALKATAITIGYLTIGAILLSTLVPQFQADMQAEAERMSTLVSEIFSEAKNESSK